MYTQEQMDAAVTEERERLLALHQRAVNQLSPIFLAAKLKVEQGHAQAGCAQLAHGITLLNLPLA